MAEESGSLDVKTPFGSISANGIKRTSEIIAILSLVIMAVMLYAFWQHSVEAKESGGAIAAQLKENREDRQQAQRELLQAIREQTRANKLQSCLLSIPMEQRQQQFENPNSLCQRLAR